MGRIVGVFISKRCIQHKKFRLQLFYRPRRRQKLVFRTTRQSSKSSQWKELFVKRSDDDWRAASDVLMESAIVENADAWRVNTLRVRNPKRQGGTRNAGRHHKTEEAPFSLLRPSWQRFFSGVLLCGCSSLSDHWPLAEMAASPNFQCRVSRIFKSIRKDPKMKLRMLFFGNCEKSPKESDKPKTTNTTNEIIYPR